MALTPFFPSIYLKSITALTPALLRRLGIRGLILDVDNTLTTHDNPEPDAEVLSWLEVMRQHRIEMIILSNNRASRVRRFATILRMGFTANAKKPLVSGFARAAAQLGLSKDKIAVVGDQVFTDILGGNRFGAKTILVRPLKPENTLFFRFKRWLERDILRTYARGKRLAHGR